MTRLWRTAKSAAQLVGGSTALGTAYGAKQVHDFRQQLAREEKAAGPNPPGNGRDQDLMVVIRARESELFEAHAPTLDHSSNKAGMRHYWLAVVDKSTQEVVHEVGMGPVGGQPFDGRNPDPLFVETALLDHRGQPATWECPAEEWGVLRFLAGRRMKIDPRRLIENTPEGKLLGRFGPDGVCVTAVLKECIEARVTKPEDKNKVAGG